MNRPSMLLVMPRFEPGVPPRQDIDLEVLLGYLRQSGLLVQAVDAQLSCLEPPALADFIRQSRPRIVYWHLALRPDFRALEATAPFLRQVTPRPLMIAGGDFAARYDLALLKRVEALDGVVRGEPELSLEAVGRSISRGEAWHYEAGVTSRNGSIRRNPSRPLLEDLDRLAMAADDLFEAGRLERGQRILFSRGCNSDCLYCGLQTVHRGELPGRTRFWRSRSAASIVNEIEHYHRHRGVSRFVFNSFVFFGYGASEGELVANIALEILRRRLSITFTFVTHPGHLVRNRTVIPLLQEAGLESLTLGIDSGLARALALYRLEFTRADIFEAMRCLHEHQVDFTPAFIFYDPFLTLDEINTNLRFLEQIEPWFGHLRRPFAYFLDRFILNTTLKVRSETPIYLHLMRQGLTEKVNPFERDPVVQFKDSETGKVHAAHRLVNRRVGSLLRPLFATRATVDRWPHLNHLPIEILRKILRSVEQQQLDPPSIASGVTAWLCEQLPPGATPAAFSSTI